MITTEKDKLRIRTKVQSEIGYLERSQAVKKINIDFKLMGMTYMNYHDAVKICLDLLPINWTLRWDESKKGVAILSKPI